MYSNQYEEHMASQPDNSRWDGFDRGDTGIPTTHRECIGRMTNGADQRVSVWEIVTNDGWGDSFARHEVHVDGDVVFSDNDNRARAIRVARWWLNGCPA